MATLFLNEGTEIEVKETAAEILELTKHKKNEEKETGASDNLIKLTAIFEEKEENKNFKYNWCWPKEFFEKAYNTKQETKTIFLYMKRVLFFYD